MKRTLNIEFVREWLSVRRTERKRLDEVCKESRRRSRFCCVEDQALERSKNYMLLGRKYSVALEHKRVGQELPSRDGPAVL